MKFAGFPVLQASIVIETIGGVAVLLDFQKQGSLSDGMDSACRDIEKISLVDGKLSEKLIPSAIPDHLFQLLAGFGPVSDDDVRVLLAVQDIPALRFPLSSLLVAESVIIIWMHLNTEVVVGIQNFYQEGKFRPLYAPKQLPVVFPQFPKTFAVIGSSPDNTLSMRIGGDDPGFSGVVSGNRISIKILHLVPAPQHLLKKGFEKNKFTHYKPPCAIIPYYSASRKIAGFISYDVFL